MTQAALYMNALIAQSNSLRSINKCDFSVRMVWTGVDNLDKRPSKTILVRNMQVGTSRTREAIIDMIKLSWTVCFTLKSLKGIVCANLGDRCSRSRVRKFKINASRNVRSSLYWLRNAVGCVGVNGS